MQVLPNQTLKILFVNPARVDLESMSDDDFIRLPIIFAIDRGADLAYIVDTGLRVDQSVRVKVEPAKDEPVVTIKRGRGRPRKTLNTGDRVFVDSVVTTSPKTPIVLNKALNELRCDYKLCEYVAKTKKGLAKHKMWHNMDRKKNLPKWLGGEKPLDEGKDAEVANCANPKCIRRRTFLKNTGYKDPVDGEEFCCKRCYEEFLERSSAEIKGGI